MAAYVDISAVNDVLLEDILPTVVNETNSPKMFLDKVLPDATKIEGIGSDTYITRIKIKTAKASGGGPRGANQTLPPHTNASWDETQVYLCRWYSTAEYDGPVGHISDVHKVVDGITDAVADVKDMLKYEQQASFAGNGNDALAEIASNSSNTYTCTDDEFWPGTRRLRVGMAVDSFDDVAGYGTGGIGMDNDVITSIPSKTTFVTTTYTTAADADYVFFADGSGTQVDNSPTGIAQIIDGPYSGTNWETSGPGQDNTTFQGIVGSTDTWWQSYVDYNPTTRYLDEELLEDCADGIKLKCGDQDILDKGDYMLYSAPEVVSRWRKDQSRDHQWVNKKEILAGVKIVKTMVNGEEIPWVEDLMCGSLVVYMINAKDLVYKSLPMEMMDEAGFVRLENYDKYRMQFKQYSQLGARRRDTHGKIRQLKV